MRKLLLGLLFVLEISTLTAQSEFFWGASFHPNISNRRLIALGTLSESQAGSLDSIEMHRISYSTGLFLGWRGEKAGIQFGLNYMDTGYRTLKAIIPPDDPQSGNGEERRFVFQNVHLELPVDLQFAHDLDDANAFLFMLGVSFSYNIKNYQKTVFFNGDQQSVEKVEDTMNEFTRFNYAFQTGVGWERDINDRFAFVLQPTFKFWLKGILTPSSGEINRSLYNLGLKIAFKIKS